ncbi:hypothetical protein JX266_007554 [Neoarthrinium moseri]|nr:hypothetical protein JX266_007554 [Neoarthrinium moseri]
MSGKRATRSSQNAASLTAPPSSSPTSSHKLPENDGGTGAPDTQSTATATAAPVVTSQQRPTRASERHADDLTHSPTSTGEPEPRRSVRATKGQHTKAFEALENGPAPPAPKRKGAAKKSKKAAEKEEEEEEEEQEEEDDDDEVIRCVCGATTQDDDAADEPWIACEQCGAWQHNVCMGMSIFDDDLPKEYFCEQCRPSDHKELLDAIANGEELWVTRRQRHEEEEEDRKKKKGKKGKGKRASDPKDRSSPAASTTKSKASPAPEIKKEETNDAAAKIKRKSRDHSQGPSSKLRKVTETRAVPAVPKYTPPADLAESIDQLEGNRRKVADNLRKSLEAALEQALKRGLFTIPKDATKKGLTERHAIEIERAVTDSHPAPSAAAHQSRSLMFNLKKNIDLAARVFNRTLTPPALAGMSSDEMATEELQREMAQMKERADKQAVLLADDGPRVRRTHKGEELIENDSFTNSEDVPSAIRRQSVRDAVAPGTGRTGNDVENSVELPANVGSGPLRIDTQAKQSPRQGNFDLEKVFSSVKSPSGPIQRRPSAPAPSAGPGDDPEVDRMLQEDRDSPPYSPTENLDPDVVWQGPLMMTNLADLRTVAKFAGGANLKTLKGIDWENLIPSVLTVAGRIPEEKAVPYLCAQRYNNQVDLVITRLSPANPADPHANAQFAAVIDYFQSKKRYGVVGERKLGNVRDTYLIPVPAGDGNLPELLENITDHLVPTVRPTPILLMVFVVRDEHIPYERQTPTALQQATPTPSTQAPTPVPDRKQSVSQPTWSPATPQGSFPNTGTPQTQHQSHTPIPPPVIPGQPAPPAALRQTPVAAPTLPPLPNDVNAIRQAQLEGEQKARQVLGPLFNSPSVTFLLPHAARMKEGEWKAVKRCLERDPRARDDLPLLSKLLTDEGNNAKQNGTPQPPAPQASPGLVQNTIAAAQATLPSGSSQAHQPKA